MIALLSLALADVVGPPPDDCPPGASGTSSHGGPYCVPSTCDGTCEEGGTCEPAGLCVLEETRECGGMQDPENPCTYLHREARGTCQTQDDCTGGTTCEIADRCVTAGPVCGCASTGALPTAVLLLGLLPLAVRRAR
ncbi:MAG: hypothetical protein R3F61_37025 [Myxococcota bacterium]